MKANSIEDALNLFDPHHPLLEEDDIKAYYVARNNSPIEEMKTILKTATDFPKLLFSGPPGCGKSTELVKLKEMLKKDFHIIIFSVKEITNTFRIDLDSMLFHILKKVADEAKEENLSIYSEKLEKVISSGIGRDSDIELASAAKDGNGIESVLDDILSEDEQKEELGYGSIFGPVFRRSFKPRADALLNLINDTVWDLEEKTKKDVLVLITDMDKLKLGNVYGLLTSSSLYLTKIQCFAVYTFPFELKYQKDFIDINRNFNGVYFLPNFIPYNRSGEPDENVQKKLKEIITKRIQSKLIYDEAVDIIVKLSGGIVYELINLVRQCCIIALMEKINFIDDEVVKDAEQRIRRVYRSVYSDEERKLLLQVRQNKGFIHTDAGKKLFKHSGFTEYGTGDDIWYDVNPILFPLLEEIELTAE